MTSKATGEASASDRLEVALDIVAGAERVSPLFATAPHETFWARGRVVRRPDVSASVIAMVPAPERSGWTVDAADVRHLTAAVSADLVVLGKLDAHDLPKLRAAYAARGMTLAAQPRAANGVCGISRAVRAHEVVGKHAPSLLPSLLDDGELTFMHQGRAHPVPYLVERWIDGSVLSSAPALSRAVPEILAGLAEVHRGHGSAPVRLSDHWGPPFVERWEHTLRSGIVPPDLGRSVSELIVADRTLRHSWTHGDLVASNVLRAGDGRHVLLDWEHSQEAPIMNDAAKLHLFAAHPDETLTAVLEAFAVDAGPHPPVVPSAFTAVEELVLCHAQLLSFYPRRSRALKGHARAQAYERQVRRQVERLAEVVSRAG